MNECIITSKNELRTMLLLVLICFNLEVLVKDIGFYIIRLFSKFKKYKNGKNAFFPLDEYLLKQMKNVFQLKIRGMHGMD